MEINMIQTFLVAIMKSWYEDKKAKVVQFYFERKESQSL